MASLKYWIWLAELPRVGSQLKLALLEHFGEPDAIYYGEKEEYSLVEGMNRSAVNALLDKSLEAADRILGDCDRLGLRVITLRDTDYPDRLRNIFDPPLLLYVQGRMPRFDDEVAIAMVGTRKVSPYAMEMGEKLGATRRRIAARCGPEASPPQSSAAGTTLFIRRKIGGFMKTSPPGELFSQSTRRGLSTWAGIFLCATVSSAV